MMKVVATPGNIGCDPLVCFGVSGFYP